MSVQVISQADARAESFAVVSRLLCHQTCRQRAELRCCLKFLESTALSNVRSADEVEVLIVAEAKIHGQALGHLPIVLEIQPKLLRVSNDECGIAHGDAHAAAVDVAANQQARSVKALWQRQNSAGQLVEIELERRVELKEAAHERSPDVINAGLEGVLANGLGDVILELVFALDRILRNVGVGAELDAGREREERGASGAVNQIVPVLESKRELVDQRGG